MTDGPFKNLPLNSCSKRFLEALCNDAVDQEALDTYAHDAILRGILREDQALIRDLQNYGNNSQLDLDPKVSIAKIYGTHHKSAFADHSQRETELRLYDGEESQVAINTGLESALETGISAFYNRLGEECIKAYQNGGLCKSQFNLCNERLAQTRQGINHPRIMEALRKGDTNAFKKDVEKQKGLDKGPKL